MMVPELIEARDKEARAILHKNDRGGYTVPTDGLYPYQWNWDSVFAAAGFATFDMGRAWAEVETLFSGQWANGMVPHILFHKVDPRYFPGPDVWGGVGPLPSSGISQPPIAGTFIRRLWDMDRDAGRAHVAALLPKLMDWHRWFYLWRNDGNGAVVVTHPWETGRDNSPDWDDAFAAIEPKGIEEYYRRDTQHVVDEERPRKWDYDRYLYLVKLGRDRNWDEAAMAEVSPFRMADPTMTFTLLRSNRDLRAMAAELGQDTTEIDTWITAQESGAEGLWNTDIQSYDVRNALTGQFTNCISNASFLNHYAGAGLGRMMDHLDRISGLVRYPVPSHDPASPAYEPKRYWRGPVWAMMNMLVAMGLSEQGQVQAAITLREKTAQMIAENGFAEYFDPRDGAPAGGRDFTWTAAVWLAWASPNAGENRWAA